VAVAVVEAILEAVAVVEAIKLLLQILQKALNILLP
jgi:hypothetical protein